MARAVWATILFLILSSTAFADDHPKFGCQETSAERYKAIMRDTIGMDCQASESNIGFCMMRDTFLSEIALAKANDEVVATMDDPVKKAAFSKAEQAWCEYREAICNWEPSAGIGGSMSGQLSSQCRKERNESRIKILHEWIACVTKGSCENPPLFFMIDKP
jgi:uncharacterized protein YecT (DUF1311 family)